MHTRKSLALATAAALASTLLGGCASSPAMSNTDDIARYQRQLQQAEAENSRLQQELAQASQVRAPAAMNNAMYPPDAKPGQCYARVMTPAKFKTVSERVQTREASEELTVVPAQYKWAEKRVVDKAASSKIVAVPATYTTESERVMVSPASKRLETVPAQYTTKTTKVVDVPAHTTWHRGESLVPGAIASKVDSTTGDVMCLVEVPATYKTITKRVLVSPATVESVAIPAEYKTVTRTVVKTPASTREIAIPATYKTIRVKKLVSDATTNATPIPAEYETVTSRELISPESLSWRRVVCETNMTASLARTLQTRLKAKGYYNGKIDGVYGRQTMLAVASYANDQGLPSNRNAIVYDVLESLGIDAS